MANDLVARGVLNRRLALEDGDERVVAVADVVEDLPHLRGPLGPVLGQRPELILGEPCAD